MADPAALADATPLDWTTPGFLADTPAAPAAPALTLTDVAPAMKATPKLRDEPKEDAFDPDAFLGSIKSSPLASSAPEMKTGAPAPRLPDQVKAPDFTDRFNTPIPEDKVAAYNAWKAKYAPNDDGSDYDLQGAFLSGVIPDSERGHFPDTFKKPNHPTFSDQSQYSGVPDGTGGTYAGGTWGKGDSYTPSDTNLAMYGKQGLAQYFSVQEPESKLIGVPPQPAPEKDFDPDTFLSSSSDMLHTTYDDKGNALGAQPVNGDLDQEFYVPGAFKDTTPAKNVVAVPAPPKLGTTSSPTANVIENADRALFGGIGSAVQWAGSLLSRLDPRVDQTDDSTNPYLQFGLNIRDFANRNFITDPNRPYSGGAGNLLGNVLPVTGTLGLGGAATIAPRLAGGAMFGGQMYTAAADQGVSTNKAEAAGAVGLGLGAFLPATKAFSAAPAIASATWGQLAKNVGYNALLNSSKTYWEMAGINWTSGETANSVLQPGQQQPQGTIAYDALKDAFPMVVAGLATHGIEQAAAETNVSRVATAQGQSKADFLMNTTQAMDAIANDPVKSPEEKMHAVTGFLASFSPDAQKAVVAHVQNIGATIDAIRAAADQAKALAPTNPMTAAALQQEQVSTAVANMQTKATAIDQEAEEAEKRAQEAFPEDKPVAGNPATEESTPAAGSEVTEPKTDTGETEQASAPAPAAPEEQPVVQSPIPGGMTSDEYGALARHMENSPDPDVQARARELLQLRQQALQEHASTDSDARKAELESEILAHEAALRNLSEEPQKEAPPVTPSAEPETVQAPQHVTGYDEYGNPVYAETPPAAEEKPAGPESTPEAAPVAESPQSEQGSVPAAEGAAGVAEQHPAEAAPAVEEKPPATPLDGLKRPALEKVALEEGHHPDDIKAAKSAKDVRDMIEAKRTVGDMETPREDLKDDGKAQVDPKINSLPAKYKKAVEAFIKTAKAGKMWGVTKFVLSQDPQTEGHAMWADPRRGTFDTIYINPIELHRIGADAAFNRKAFQEERLHNQAGYILNKRWEAAGKPGSFEDFYNKNFQAIHDQMSKSQRNQTQETYGIAGMHPVNIGEEYFRQTMQKAMGEKLTEDEYRELAKRLRNNRPLRNIVQAVKERLTAMVQKLTSKGIKDDELTLAEQKLNELMGGGKKAEPAEEAEGEPAASGLPPRPEEDDESKLWLSGDEGVRPAPVITPMKSPKQMEEYKPFVEEGETPGELKPTGAEQLRSQRAVPAEAQEREQTITNRIHSLEHVDIPADRQQEFRQRATDLARLHFSNEAARDLAESNAYVKVMIEAKKWQEQHGSLDGFGSRRIIQNSLLDDGRRVSRGQSIAAPSEESEASTEGENEPQPKGYDASAQGYEEQQSQFEPVGTDSSQLATTETPAKRAQDAMVNRNLQEITNRISPYGRRLLEIWADTPHDPSAAFAPWVSRAAKEFGLPRSKIMADFDALTTGMRREINQRGLTKDDFARMPGLPPLRQEGFAKQGENDERLKDTLRSVLASRVYEQKANQVTNDEANEFLAQHGDDAAYAMVLDRLKTGRPTATDNAVAQKLILKLDSAPPEDGTAHLKAAEMATTLSAVGKAFGQFTQAFRMWSKLGANGVLQAYDKIIRPAIEGAKTPYKAVTDAIENTIKGGRKQAVDETLDRLDKSGVTGKADRASTQAKPKAETSEDKNIWQQYVDASSDALAKAAQTPAAAKVKGPLEQFANRLKANLTDLLRETNPKEKTEPQPKLGAVSKLVEVYKHLPEYRQAWDEAKANIEETYADRPDVLENVQDALDRAFEVPVKLHDQALKAEVADRGTSFRKIAKEFPDSTVFKNGVVKSLVDQAGLKDAEAEKATKDIGDRFDQLLKQAKQENADAQTRADQIKAANENSIKQGVPLWTRYTNEIAQRLSSMVDTKSAPTIKPAMQEFASRVATNLKALVNEARVTSALSKPQLSADQKFGEIYRNFPEYQKAWDEARNAMRQKIGDDPAKLKEFDAALNKTLAAPAGITDKVLTDALKSSGVSLRDVAKQWADSQNATRDSLIKAITDKMGLTPEQAKAAGDAIASRFQERLEAAKKNEVAKLLRQSGQNKLANAAPDITDKIFKALNLGAADSDVIWNAVAEKYGLPKYDKAVAQDLARRANDIQKYLAKNPKGGKISDDMTQDMMNILANEAQKNMSYLRQVGEGELAIFYGNIFGPSTVGRKSYSEVLNLIGDVGLMGLVQMRHGDVLAVPRAYLAALHGLYLRGGADIRSIIMSGRGMRQMDGDYTANNLVERGQIFGNVPVLSKLNKPLSMLYKPVGRVLYGAQAFFYAGAFQARANMIADRAARQLIREGKVADDVTVNRLTQEILGNSPEMRQGFADQAREEGLTGRAAILRARELAEQSWPDEIRQAAHNFASRTTFMQDPEGVLGELQKKLSDFQRIKSDDSLSLKGARVASRLAVPVTRVVSNVFNNYMAYTPLGLFGAARFAKAGDSDMAYLQMAKVTAGALSTLAMYSMFGSNIQGAGPKDYDKRKQLLDQGWIPFSVKIGNSYYSYREWPIALMMAGVGSYHDQGKYGEDAPHDMAGRLALALSATGRFAITSSWISSVSGALDAISSSNYQNSQKAFYNSLGSTAGALVPFNQSTLKVIDKIFDPQLYPPNSVQGALMSQVTVARRFDNGNAPMLNALGDPVESNPIQAFFSSTNPDPVWNALAEKNIFIPVATKAERVNGRPITNEEFYALTRDAGQATKETLMTSGMEAMASMDQEQAQHYLSAVYRRNIKTVKAQIAASAVDAGQGAAPTSRARRR